MGKLKYLSIPVVSILLLFNIYSSVKAQEIITKSLSSQQWAHDLDEFVKALEKIHPDPYFRYHKEAFYNDLNALKSRLNTLSNDEIFLELMKLVASLQDGHTHIPMHQELGLTSLPLKFFLFDDGLFITDAKNNPELIGKKVVMIGNRNIQDLIYEFEKLIPADNKYHEMNNIPFHINIPQLLKLLNATASKERVTISVLDGNRIREVKVTPIARHSFFQWAFAPAKSDKLPLYRRKSNDLYWLSYLEEEGIMYMKYNQVLSADSYPIQEITHNLDSLSRARNAGKIVIDLRDNPGGNSYTMTGLMKMLKEHPLNQPGKLFLIGGRRSNSAVTNFISEMRLESNAILVGEPIGGSPNFYSDVRNVTLPNSNLTIAISTLFQKGSFYEDDRRSHYPDIPVSLTSTDYFSNNDPFLDAVKTYQPQNIEQVSFSRDDVQNFLGRYACTLTQACELKFENGSLIMAGENVIHKKFYHQGGLKFRDYNNSIILSLNSNDKSVGFRGYGIFKTMQKLPSGTLTAIEKIEHGMVKEGIEEIRKMKESHASPKIVSESVINKYGYKYLRQDEFQKSIDLFILNTELYPKSANVYDSLGEAYLVAGDKSKAVQNYRKSLEINPNNETAKEVLKKAARK